MNGSPPLRAASVGLGWWSDELAKSLDPSSQKIRIVACTSRSPDKRAKFAERFSARALDSYEEVLADTGIDAVILTTPHSQHGEHVRMAARAGKHVFVEKPFTLTTADGRSAAQACMQSGVVLAVGHNRRYAAATQWLKDVVSDGTLGTILHIEANFSAPGGLSYTSDRWRANRKESPGGSIAGLGIHMIDLMCFLAGPIQTVNARAIRRAVTVEMDDTTSALFQFVSGPTGYLGTSFACPYTTTAMVYGTQGNAFIDPDAGTGWLKRSGQSDIEHKRFELSQTLRMELEEFADACRGTGTFRITPSEAIHNVAVMEAMVASSAANGIPIEPSRDGVE